MKRKIFHIGKLTYILTILFGKKRNIVRQTVDWKNSNGEAQSESSSCDYIVTVGKRAVIITESNFLISKRRIPFIVKPWKYLGRIILEEGFDKTVSMYADCEGHLWSILNDHDGMLITYYDGDDWEKKERSLFEKGKTRCISLEASLGY